MLKQTEETLNQTNIKTNELKTIYRTKQIKKISKLILKQRK